MLKILEEIEVALGEHESRELCLANSELCLFDEDCCGYCADIWCADKKEYGSECDWNSECKSGYCPWNEFWYPPGKCK